MVPSGTHSSLIVEELQSEERCYPMEAGSVPSIGPRQPLGDGSSEPFVGDADRLGSFFATEPLQSQQAIEVLSQDAIGRNTGDRQSFKNNSSLTRQSRNQKGLQRTTNAKGFTDTDIILSYVNWRSSPKLQV